MSSAINDQIIMESIKAVNEAYNLNIELDDHSTDIVIPDTVIDATSGLKDKTIQLKTVNSNTFDIVIKYVYTGNISRDTIIESWIYLPEHSVKIIPAFRWLPLKHVIRQYGYANHFDFQNCILSLENLSHSESYKWLTEMSKQGVFSVADITDFGLCYLPKFEKKSLKELYSSNDIFYTKNNTISSSDPNINSYIRRNDTSLYSQILKGTRRPYLSELFSVTLTKIFKEIEQSEFTKCIDALDTMFTRLKNLSQFEEIYNFSACLSYITFMSTDLQIFISNITKIISDNPSDFQTPINHAKKRFDSIFKNQDTIGKGSTPAINKSTSNNIPKTIPDIKTELSTIENDIMALRSTVVSWKSFLEDAKKQAETDFTLRAEQEIVKIKEHVSKGENTVNEIIASYEKNRANENLTDELKKASFSWDWGWKIAIGLGVLSLLILGTGIFFLFYSIDAFEAFLNIILNNKSDYLACAKMITLTLTGIILMWIGVYFTRCAIIMMLTVKNKKAILDSVIACINSKATITDAETADIVRRSINELLRPLTFGGGSTSSTPIDDVEKIIKLVKDTKELGQ